jgi:hypothetical protein
LKQILINSKTASPDSSFLDVTVSSFDDLLLKPGSSWVVLPWPLIVPGIQGESIRFYATVTMNLALIGVSLGSFFIEKDQVSLVLINHTAERIKINSNTPIIIAHAYEAIKFLNMSNRVENGILMLEDVAADKKKPKTKRGKK